MTKEEIRLARKLKGPSQMARVRAARAMIEANNNDEGMIMAAFMEFFHPNHPQTRGLVNEARERKRARLHR